MRGIEILLVSVLVAFTQGTNSSAFPKWQSSWIQGGSDAAPEEFPYMVSVKLLKPKSVYWAYCGGTVISYWYILTAAHCLLGATASKVQVLTSTNELYRGGKIHRVARIIRHKSFSTYTYNNDIALLRLKKPLVYSPSVKPVRLPVQGETTAPGTQCIVMGWGYTSSFATSLPDNLQKLHVITISNDECLRKKQFVLDTTICATADLGKGICMGDSGDPLICDGKQIGVLSRGIHPEAKCTSPFPSVYIYLSKYIDWISSNIV